MMMMMKKISKKKVKASPKKKWLELQTRIRLFVLEYDKYKFSGIWDSGNWLFGKVNFGKTDSRR